MNKSLVIQSEANSNIKETLSKDLYFIRGIAIALVALGHVIGNRDSGIRQLYEQDIPYMRWIYNFIYTFHMPIFFIISGISFRIFSSSNNSYTKFINSKFTRILIPLVCWAPIYYIFRSLSGIIKFSFIGFIQSVIYPNFIFWFFHALLLATLLSFLTIKKLGSQLVYYAISIALFALSFNLKEPLVEICYFNIFYAFGIAIAPYITNIRFKLEKAPSSLTFLLLLTCTFLMLSINYFLGSEYGLVIKFMNGIIGFTFMYILATWNQPFPMFQWLNRSLQSIADVFVYFGLLSMTIYLLHILVGSTTRTILVKFGITDPLIQFTFGYIASTLGPILIYSFLHKRSKLFRYSIGEAK
ncbi:MAG: acyltransferase [Komarekiella atlantica HA4396-MV6]|jgi:fucose 4-O-acetylase-like acetyltransferase|nr:acyltransferase [Komarekiella atlantica HA4396-MV6]